MRAIAFFLFGVVICHGASQAQLTGTAFPVSLPATFAGDLPCADCPGIRHQLDLLRGEAFFLRTTYRGREGSETFDIGSWIYVESQRTLMLFGAGAAPLKFAFKDADTLRKLDLEGHEIVSKLNHDLKRSTGLPLLEPRLIMRGMYRYQADAGRFVECLTRQGWPVAQELDNAALESAYSRLRREPGEELLAEVQARVVVRPKVEGAGQQATLVVERFAGVWPGESCGTLFSTESLENTYWKLTRLKESPVIVAEGQREPHLVLNAQSGRVSGYGGCNRLSGSYERAGDRLSFGQIAGTRMACAHGMDIEGTFLDVLGQVRSAKLLRQHLDFYDAAGERLARFEARQLR